MFLCRSWYFGITQTPTVLDDCRGFPSDFSQKTTFQTILTESECLYRSISGTYTSKNGWKCPYGSIQWTCTSTQGDNRPWHCPNPESKHLERSDGAIRRPAGPGIWRQRRQIRNRRASEWRRCLHLLPSEKEEKRSLKANRPRGCMRGQSPLY